MGDLFTKVSLFYPKKSNRFSFRGTVWVYAYEYRKRRNRP